MDPVELDPLPATFPATVSSLHRIAEELVAPARKPDNEIALAATPGGFGTPEFEFEGALQQVRVEGAELVRSVEGGERRAPLRTLAEAGAILEALVPPTAEFDDEPLAVDEGASLVLGAFYGFAAEVLDQLVATVAPEDDATPPRLWPEHFDIAIELGSEADGARANYGASPGDENHPEPYFYVSPWSVAVSGELWNATGFTGAELSYAELLMASDPRVTAFEFLATRRKALASNRGSQE